MTVSQPHWENSLLALALPGHINLSAHGQQANRPTNNPLLIEAYNYCAALTAHHSRSFHLSSGLLPDGQRQAARALYAFCRISDDLVDNPQGNPQEALTRWRVQAFNSHPSSRDPIVLAWHDARRRFHIPEHYAHQLLDGVARDLDNSRYNSFADLTTYCYGVASTVGLMSMHIIGFSGPQAVPYAIKLGVALQMTNILRDVAEDFSNGRVYLPQDELAAFGLTEGDLRRGVVTDSWRAFMQFQIERTRQLYDEAWPGIGMLNASGRMAIAAAAELYRGILSDIEKHDYDVFSRRAHVSTMAKLSKLPGIWWRSRQV
ncbi:MAG: squalene/phytoene synthase family protein [Anaerolineae bacterium]|nr:squalene/phytoene synthase family protein [Anaerolineae bacterium]